MWIRFKVIIACWLIATTITAQNKVVVRGKVTSPDKTALEFVSVYVKETNHNSQTNEKGEYHIYAPMNEFTLVFSMLGYEKAEYKISLGEQRRIFRDVVLKPVTHQLDEVVVAGKSNVQRINESAYNAVAIDAKALHNTTANLSSAIGRVSGVKIRESGGVGSDMQLSLDGFTGKHVKLFIDGVPQEGVGSSFSLNNIPVNYAERIEIYKGVVPVGFGADAIGGVVNIVTGARKKMYADVSYSYGSFNTHKSYINAGQTFDNGFTYEINAFQNYSDNSYDINTPVKNLTNGQINKTIVERVKRFNDAYHNEAVIGKAGVVNKSYADKLIVGFNYSQSYNEIQNGVRQEIVFGEKKRRSHSFMPSLEYLKKNLLTPGLTLSMTANYNRNITHNIDTATYVFNWRGESKYNGGNLGEQTYQDDEFANDNWNGTVTASYQAGESHSFVFNHVLNAFNRKTISSVNSDNASVAASFDKTSMKNISGLSYKYNMRNLFNISVFGKYYNQRSTGPRNESTTGGFSYVEFSESVSAIGYGAAGTYYIMKNLQAKISYEKAYRLPTTDELFGDEDMELGAVGLKPENSDNVNLSVSYNVNVGKHAFYVEGGVIYRDTRDYIRRTLNSFSGGLYYGLYENHGRVETKGFNAEARYNFLNIIYVGGNISYLNIVDKEKYSGGNTLQESTSYGVRLPNTPYMFANGDVTVNLKDCFAKTNTLGFTYSNHYVKEFPLYWESHGDKSTKERVPTQFTHDVTMVYSIRNGMLNFSLECHNLLDARVYDNFSLQKAGRAFYGKVRYSFGK